MKYFHWWNVFDDICRQGRWSFWSWFDVNLSTFARKNYFFCIFIPSDLDLWPYTVDLKIFTSVNSSNFPQNINCLPLSERGRPMWGMWGMWGLCEAYVTDRQTEKWRISAGEVYSMMCVGSLCSQCDVNQARPIFHEDSREKIFLHFRSPLPSDPDIWHLVLKLRPTLPVTRLQWLLCLHPIWNLYTNILYNIRLI